MVTIQNPILPGFNPDPSVVRVGADYYIATSTFEWFPGVQIHHSTDLVHWDLVGHPLDRVTQLDMRGNPPSGGIWAPCLTHDGAQFYLVYTDVKHLTGAFKDTHNYLVTAPAIIGPWSEPVYLNSSGFDPSLFHDEDGRKWLVNMDWDWRPDTNSFAGILIQEYDHALQRLVGPITRIFTGSELGVTEGPHLYRREGYYYLLTAEGGTGHDHAVTMARSRSLFGPYEIDPHNPILTSVGAEDVPLKKAGHADIVDTPSGEWYMVHLCSRPIGAGARGRAEGWSILGRETAIQKVAWTEDGWLRLESGGRSPAVTVPSPRQSGPAAGPGASAAPAEESAPRQNEPAAVAGASAAPAEESAPRQSEPAAGPHPNPAGTVDGVFHDDFDDLTLNVHWQSPRIRLDTSHFSLSQRPGYLRLHGGESPSSRFNVSMIARRQQSFRCRATTSLDFFPESYKQLAGLICYYNDLAYHYLYVTTDDDGANRRIGILSRADGKEEFPIRGDEPILPREGALILRADIDHNELRFSFSSDGQDRQVVGADLDATILSDEFGSGWGFTGSFIGVTCQDLAGLRRDADFAWFRYEEL